MAYGAGGRADKSGNRFENNWTINKILDVLYEKALYLTIEAVGDDEKGVDLWVGNKDGSREGQQCKGRFRSNEYWTYGSIREKGIWDKWKFQLESSKKHFVSLVSPLVFTMLEDMAEKARNTDITKPKIFYEYQIKKSGTDTINFFHQYCGVMGLDYTTESGLTTAINYLSRTFYRKFDDYELKEILAQRIGLLFIGDVKEIYSKFLKFILTEDIWGKKIDALMITNYCKENHIIFRDLARDERILPAISDLNDEYKSTFRKFQYGYIVRNEAKTCWQWILEGKSIIIHGYAGMGKSGCTENIIQFCENHEILYLAVKLDKRIPHETSERWGQSMGLPSSISHCLNAISYDKQAVLIFDQLDALRWTQAHSSEALAICRKIIQEIEQINLEREHKISIVMVCRTYDLENDYNIKNLFDNSGKSCVKIEWKRICVDKLSSGMVKTVVGSSYDALSQKTKDLLSTASNLYIWEQLDIKEKMEINTTHQLVRKWWDQLKSKADRNNLDSDKLERIKESFVKNCDKGGKMYVSTTRMKMPKDHFDFLLSNGFFILSGNNVSLVHQSILDCFFAELMLDQFYENISISEIIGERRKQTPGRRYQVQIFLQLLMGDSEEDFLLIGEEMLTLKDVRYNVKYVFLEILSQIIDPSEDIFRFVRKYLWDDEWGKHFRNMVVLGKSVYVRKLRECGDLDMWMQNKEKYRYVINLFSSIVPNYNKADLTFLGKYVLDPEKGDEWSRCLLRDIQEGCDEYFELKLSYCKQFPQLLQHYKSLFFQEKIQDLRTIKLVALMLEQNEEKEDNRLYYYDKEYTIEDADIFKEKYKYILELLLPFIPMEEQGIFSNWSARYSGRNSLQRVCVQIVKNAIRQFAKKEPVLFLSRITCYMGTGIYLHNELVLYALRFLPDSYADYIIDYMCFDFEQRLFEDTSGNGDKLLLAKALIEKNAYLCSHEKYSKLEFCIIHYSTPDAKEKLKRRIEYNKTKKKEEPISYLNFRGDLQNDLLNMLPLNRMSKEAKELKKVLERSHGNFSIYQYEADCRGMGLNSPIAGKTLKFNGWKRILLSEKLPLERFGLGKEKNGKYIDNSRRAFSAEFQKVVSDSPADFLGDILNVDEEIDTVFIKALARGIAYSSRLDEVCNETVEKLFVKYPYDYGTGIALEYCEIIERKRDIVWSESTMDMLCDIINNYELYIKKDSLESSGSVDTIEEIQNNMLYSVREMAVLAIEHILYGCPNILGKFKKIIDKLIIDNDFSLRYACVNMLWAAYNADKDWAIVRIAEMYKADYRLAGFSDRGILFALYDDYYVVAQDVLRKGFCSEDLTIQRKCCDTIAEIYFMHHDFCDIIDEFPVLDNKQKNAIVGMFITYFGIERYHESAKIELKRILEYNDDKLTNVWSGLFNENAINLKEDREFLLQLMTSRVGAKIMFSFVRYLEKQGNLLDYADIIINMAYGILKDTNNMQEDRWLIEKDLVKLIWALYDEANCSGNKKETSISQKCLDIWDMMFENQIGGVQELTRKMMEL